MNARLLVAIALVFCAVAARAEETEAESSELATVETVEPTFVETTATAVAAAETEAGAEAEGFPFRLPRRMRETTMEPRYFGEDGRKPREFVHPEYRNPHPRRFRHHRRHHRHGKHHHKKPAIFVSHYFSPMPKQLKGKKLRVRRDREARRRRHLVPFRAHVETPARHAMHKRGHVVAELRDGRLPNKFNDPRKRHKKVLTPAPLVFVEEEAAATEEDAAEVDTTDEMEAEETGAVPPPFAHDLGEEQATVVQSDEFYSPNMIAPVWKDEEATEASLVEVDADADAEEEAEDEDEEEAEDESEDESEDEAEAEDELEDEEEADEESEDESEAEAEDDSEEQEAEPVSFVEAGAAVAFDANDAEADEMEQNEIAAQQIDMDATSDEAAMTEEAAADAEAASEEVVEETIESLDADELSADSEADSTEEIVEEGEALEEAENADAVSLVEEQSEADNAEVETLLAEVDSHLSGEGEGEGEGEAETEAAKGTPGHSIAAGQTWEEAQNARLNAMEAKIAAEKAAVPRVAAAMVASKAELHSLDAAHQAPEYDTPAAHEEMLEPELLVETAANAQTVLLEKIAKLKAIRRA